MKFVLVPERLENFDHLREHFELERNVELDKKISVIGLPTLFGGTDIRSRGKQIAFLEKMNMNFRKNYPI
jgi:hypothetical protein